MEEMGNKRVEEDKGIERRDNGAIARFLPLFLICCNKGGIDFWRCTTYCDSGILTRFAYYLLVVIQSYSLLAQFIILSSFIVFISLCFRILYLIYLLLCCCVLLLHTGTSTGERLVFTGSCFVA